MLLVQTLFGMTSVLAVTSSVCPEDVDCRLQAKDGRAQHEHGFRTTYVGTTGRSETHPAIVEL